MQRESEVQPAGCRELVARHPNYLRITDASGHGVSGIIIVYGMCPNSVLLSTTRDYEEPIDIE